jgi:TonB family protein
MHTIVAARKAGVLKVQPNTLDALVQAGSLTTAPLAEERNPEYILAHMLAKIMLAVGLAVLMSSYSVGDNVAPGTTVYRVCSKNKGLTSDCAEKPPRVISAPDPEYTEEARQNGIQGSVSLSAVIAADGHVTSVSVKRGPGRGLEENAVRAVRAWTFTPALKNGEPVAVQIDIEVNFRLGSFGAPHGPPPKAW